MDSRAILDSVRSVTGAWARQRRAEEREAARVWRRREALTRSRRITIREAAWSVMTQAYLKASSGGTLPAHARQVMYAARGEIQRLTPIPLRTCGRTAPVPREIEFLRTRRVELNAFASADFIALIERKLEQHGIAKGLPDCESLTLAYRRGLALEHLSSRLRQVIEAAQEQAEEAAVPDDLGALVAERMDTDRALSWDEVIRQLVLERATGVPERDPWTPGR